MTKDYKHIFRVLLDGIGSLSLAIYPILVEEDIRQSFLIEYDNVYNVNPESLEKYYEEFFNFNYIKTEWGIFITKKKELSFDIHNYTDKEMGEFLSYPCAGDINGGREYRFEIILSNESNNEQLVGMVCKVNKSPELENFIAGIKSIVDLVDHNIKFQVVFEKLYEFDTLITYAKEEILAVEIRQVIINKFFNYGFVLLNILHNTRKFDMFDSKNKMLLIMILNMCKNDEKMRHHGFITESNYLAFNDYILISRINYSIYLARDIFDYNCSEDEISEAYRVYFKDNDNQK